MNIKDFVGGGPFGPNDVHFDSYRKGFMYYHVQSMADLAMYQFCVPIEDVGDGTLKCVDKAITYMRWIRKAIENGELTRVSDPLYY